MENEESTLTRMEKSLAKSVLKIQLLPTCNNNTYL